MSAVLPVAIFALYVILLILLLATPAEANWIPHRAPACLRWLPLLLLRALARRRRDVSKAFADQRLLFGCIFFGLSWLALPMGMILDVIMLKCDDNKALTPDKKKARKQNIIDIWHFVFLILTLVILLTSVHLAVLLLIPALKLVDLFQTMLRVTMNPSEASRGSARPLVHLLVHYLQLAVTFACAYMVLSACCGNDLFKGDRLDYELRPLDALYFSIVTLATVGFGNVTPRLPSGTIPAWYCKAALYVEIEILAAVGLTLLFVPYFVALATAGSNGKGPREPA